MDGFIIIGNGGAITYKDVFPLIKEGKMGLGYKPFGGEMYFHITDEYKEEIVKTKKEGTGWVEIDGEVMAMVKQACWFSSLPAEKRPLVLTKTYDPDKYPKYDNYPAIEVSRIKDIPYDYDGVMGVPVTILDYCLDDIEIVGNADSGVVPEGWSGMSEEFVKLYYEQGNTGKYQVGNRLTHYVKDGMAVIPYNRILIRRKNYD